MLSDADTDGDHYSPTLRVLEIEKQESSCGFHLTRGKWDPYPWVNSVDGGSAADVAGMRAGDCLLEVNGEDIVGRRICEIAELVRSRPKLVSLLLWNAGADPQCTPEALCCGPMPRNLQRLSACMSSILTFLECPVCLDTIPPPTYQCDNGHLICMRCRAKSERCPICRLRLTRGRSLLADQVYNALVHAFELREESEEKKTTKMQQIFKLRGKNKKIPDIKVTQSQSTKLLTRLIGKSSSDDNLTSSSMKTPSECSSAVDEFTCSNLKTKSLSTNEICYAGSPAISRVSSVNKLDTGGGRVSKKYLHVENRPASYHGSFESLDRNKSGTISGTSSSLVSIPSQFKTEQYVHFQCPYELNCYTLIIGSNVLDHFKTAHEGPLVQYFKPNVVFKSTNLANSTDNACYVIHYDENLFFLKILKQCSMENDNKKSPESFNILLWVWCLGTKEIANEYKWHLRIGSEDSSHTLMSVQSSVYSLNSVLWKEIQDSKMGIFLSARTLDTFRIAANTNVILDIAIAKMK